MPRVQFELPFVKATGGKNCRRIATGALICLAVSLSAGGGCANQVAQYQPPLFMDSGAAVVAGAATAEETATDTSGMGQDDTSDWTKRTYVYRGGRDPKTGLARTQL